MATRINPPLIIPVSDSVPEPKKRDRFIYLVSLFTIVVAVGLALTMIYWTTLQPSQVYSVKGNMIKVVPPEVQAGDTVMVSFSFCKLLEVDGVVTRSFVSKNSEVLGTSNPENIGKTCINNVNSEVTVPGQAAPGEYRIKYVASYKINPIKTVNETFYSEPFVVTARAGTGEGTKNY